MRITMWNWPKGKRKVGRSKIRWADDFIDTTGKGWQKTTNATVIWMKLEKAVTRGGVHT